MKTKTYITVRPLLCTVIMFLSFLLLSCHKEIEPIPSSTPSGGNTEPQSGDIITNAVMDVDGHFYDAILIGIRCG